MNKKIVGGLLALLFVTSAVQMGAISKLQKTAMVPRTQAVAMVPVEQNYDAYQYDFSNQQAAVYSGVPINPEPEYGGYWVNDDGECGYMEHNADGSTSYYGGGTAITPDSSGGDGYSSTGCSGATPMLSNPNSGGLNMELSDSGESFEVSGESTSVLQFKLFLLGYLDLDQVTGKFDGTTKSAVMEFQKNTRLPQSGTYGSQTRAALDSTLSSIKRFSFATDKTFTFTK